MQISVVLGKAAGIAKEHSINKVFIVNTGLSGNDERVDRGSCSVDR